MDNSKRRMYLRILFVIGFLLSVAGTYTLYVHYEAVSQHQRDEVLKEAQRIIDETAKDIDAHLRPLIPLTTALAEDLSRQMLSLKALESYLIDRAKTQPNLFGVGVAFEPFAFSSQIKLFAPYLTTRGQPSCPQPRDGRCLVSVDYDYTEFAHRWYREPFLNGAMWNEPHFGMANQTLLAEYAVPLYRGSPGGSALEPIGVVFANYSLDYVRQLLNESRISRTGYGFLISPEGRFLAHPRHDFVKNRKTIFQLAWAKEDTVLQSMAIRAITGEKSYIEHVDPETQQEEWIVFQPIPSTGWALGGVFIKEELLKTETFRGGLIQILLGMMLSTIFLGALVATLWTSGIREVWSDVVLVSLCFVVAIVCIWIIEDTYPDHEMRDVEVSTGPQSFTSYFPNGKARSIVDESTLQQILHSYEDVSEEAGQKAPLYIPTGLFLQSIEFSSSTNVEVTGYLWQTYQQGVHKGIARGFILPEANDLTVELAYHEADQNCPPLSDAGLRDCSELLGWYFSGTLRQNFAYDRYPFDRQEVWLRLWHKDFARNVVLVPDLQSYDVMNHVNRPGLEQEFVLPGWSIVGSGFEYRLHGYNTDFGIRHYVGQENFPELYFSVEIKRDFLSPFISKFIPQLVIASMLFAILLTGSKREERATWLGFSAQDVVLGCAALFFVLIFDQASLRDKLPYDRIMYIESFYFILYVAIMLVCINAILFAVSQSKLIQYQDNLLLKLGFWPVVTGAMLMITLGVFY